VVALAITKAVVCHCVVLVPRLAVGAVGIPVNAGLAAIPDCSSRLILSWLIQFRHLLPKRY